MDFAMPYQETEHRALVSLQAIVFLTISFGMAYLLTENQDFLDRN
jgi:hypothetical protein